MKKLFYAASIYLVLGLSAGLYYREFTKANDYTAADGFTQLAVAHTHLLTLGVIVLLIVLALEKVFALSNSKAFTWFFVALWNRLQADQNSAKATAKLTPSDALSDSSL